MVTNWLQIGYNLVTIWLQKVAKNGKNLQEMWSKLPQGYKKGTKKLRKVTISNKIYRKVTKMSQKGFMTVTNTLLKSFSKSCKKAKLVSGKVTIRYKKVTKDLRCVTKRLRNGYKKLPTKWQKIAEKVQKCNKKLTKTCKRLQKRIKRYSKVTKCYLIVTN